MVVFVKDTKKINVTVDSEELLRGFSVLKAPFLLRYLVSFSTAFVSKQHLRQLPYIVLVNYTRRPTFVSSSGFPCGENLHRHKALTYGEPRPRTLLVFSFNPRPPYPRHPMNSRLYGLHILFAWNGEEKNLLPLQGIELTLLYLQPPAQSQYSLC